MVSRDDRGRTDPIYVPQYEKHLIFNTKEFPNHQICIIKGGKQLSSLTHNLIDEAERMNKVRAE